MHLAIQVNGDTAVLSLWGESLAGGPGLTLPHNVRALLDHDCHHIVIDMGRVRYADSAGLGALVETFAAARNRGATIELSRVTRQLKSLLVVTRLMVVFDCFDEDEETIDAYAARPTVN